MRFLAARVAADAAALATQAGLMLTVAPAPKAAETTSSVPISYIVPTMTLYQLLNGL